MPTRSPDPASVERTCVSGRKAPGIDLHLGAQQGPKVCGLHERTHQFDVTVGKELSEFQQSNGPTDRGPVLSMTGQMPNAGKGKMPPSPSVSEWDVLGSPTLSQTPSVSPKGKRGQSEVENETDITKMDVVKVQRRSKLFSPRLPFCNGNSTA